MTSTGSRDSFVHLHVHTEYSMLDGAARVGDLFAEASRMEMPALAMTDHGNVFGAYDFWKRGRDAGVKPIIGRRPTSLPAPTARDKTRVRWADGGEDDVSGGGAYTHMTMLAETTDGHAQPVPALQPGQPRGPLLQAADGPRAAADLRQGHHRHHRLPVGRGADAAAASGRYDDAKRSAAEFQDIFGKDNFFCELMDHGLGIEQRGAGRPAPARPRAGHAARGDQRPALHLRPRTPRRTRSCSACSPVARWPTRPGSSSTPTTSTSRPRPRCASCGATTPRPATTPWPSPSGATCRSSRAPT